MKINKKFEGILDALNDTDWRARPDLEFQIGRLERASASYKYNVTGDCCVNDEILFIDRIWERKEINRFGKMANVVTHYDVVSAKIIADSYGDNKGQHTFTLALKSKEKRLIKGRNGELG